MANRLFRCEMLFNTGQQGFTEKYVRFMANPKDAANFPLAALTKILRLKNSSVSLYGIRASHPLVPGDEYLRVYNLPGLAPFQETGGARDVASTAAYIRMISDSNRKANFYLRGLSDSAVEISVDGNRSNPTAEFRAAVADLEEYLRTDATFGTESPTPTTEAGFQWQTILNIAPQGTNPEQTVITLQNDMALITVPPGAGAPPAIIIRGVDQQILPGLNGQFRVAAVDHPGKTVTVWYRWRAGVQSVQPPRAYARPWFPRFGSISEFAFQRFTSRKTGGPTVRSRGRRRPVTKRR